MHGLLKTADLSPSELAREAGTLSHYHDPQAILDAEWRLINQSADELRKQYPNLSKVLAARPKTANKQSLLAVAVQYYFRREVQSDEALFKELALARWEALEEALQKGFAALTQALTTQGQRLNELLAGLDERIEHLEKKMDQILEKLDLLTRELRPRDSLSIRSEPERQRVRQLVEFYRSLPPELTAELPGLLIKLGKVNVASGNFETAQADFGKAAALFEEPRRRAEAHYNIYRAALERQQWAAALDALRSAVRHDPGRFTPFPFDLYEPQRILGAGGFGVVFLCRHCLLDRSVVVKALLPSELDRTMTDVLTEAQALADLDHPAIVHLRDFGFADAGKTRPYLVMDFFEGLNLNDYVAAHGKLSPDDAIAIFRPVAEALKVAHAKGILHRDIKPGNLLVRREGADWKVKLIDFGLALRPEMLAERGSTQGSDHTTTGQSIAGTMQYAAPEQMGQLPGAAVGPYSDVWGFGKTCYYALLKVPNPDDGEKESLPDNWRRLLGQCTGRRLVNRLPDFAAVLAKLESIGQGEGDREKRLAEEERLRLAVEGRLAQLHREATDAFLSVFRKNFMGAKNLYLHPDIPLRKANNVRSKYSAFLQGWEELLAVYDGTMFGTGDDGFVLTNRGIGWSASCGSPNYGLYQELKPDEIRKDPKAILLKEKEACVYKSDLDPIFTALQRSLREVRIICEGKGVGTEGQQREAEARDRQRFAEEER